MILILLIGVLWAGTAGAEILLTGQSGQNATSPEAMYVRGEKVAEHIPGEWVRVQSSCELKIQAAMEAMDKWIGSKIPYTDKMIKKVYSQWTEAKACWRKP